jgi:O-antigen ligase
MNTTTTIPHIKQPLWFIGFIALLALAPLPFGSNRPWASDMLGLATAILLALCTRDVFRERAFWPSGAPWRRIAFSAGSVMLVVIWGYVQTVSWFPAPHPLWAQADAALGVPERGSISLTPDGFSEAALRIFTYLGCFLMAFFGARHATRARILLRSLAFIAVGYAFYGLSMKSSGLEVVLWFTKWAYVGQLTSTFINKNSYATYAGLGLLTCLGFLWEHIKSRPSLRLSVVTIERIGAKDFYQAVMCLTVFGALLLTESRGGITSTLIACFALMIALAVNRGWDGKKRLILLLPVALFIVGLASFNAEMFLDRLDGRIVQSDSMLRINAYATIARALDDNPWHGFGLGALESAFHLYRNAEVHEWFEHAHNDYLELAMELGIPATILYLAAIGVMVGCCAQGIVHRRKNEIYSIVAVAATALVGLHALVDFSMEIPAIAATYAALLGMGVAQSWSSKQVSDGQ